MKLVKRLVVVVAVLLVVVVGALVYFKDAAVRRGVITGGDMVLGQGSTKLDGANLGLFSGSLRLTGLKLDNPDPYRQPHFFALDDTQVSVSIGSLMGDMIVVPTVTLDGLHVVAETSLEQGLPRLNLITIKSIVDESMGPAKPSDPKPADEAGKKFVIEKLNVTNMKVTGALTMPGGTSVPVNFTVPDFVIEGIGEKEHGIVMKEVIAIVLDAILAKAIEGVGQIGGIGLDMFQGGADALKNIGGEALRGVGGAVEGSGGAVRGILGGGEAKEGEEKESGGGIGGMLRGIGGGNRQQDAPAED